MQTRGQRVAHATWLWLYRSPTVYQSADYIGQRSGLLSSFYSDVESIQTIQGGK